MDDDIANAINSLEGDAAGGLTPAADLPSPSTADTNMPPIFRPDDMVAEPEIVVAPVPEAPEENSTAPTVEEGASEGQAEAEQPSMEQTYAPMPQVPTEAPVAIPSAPVGVPREPIRDSYNSPAMVADPLLEKDSMDSRGMSVAVDGTLIERPASVPVEKSFTASGKKAYKKVLMYSGLVVLLVAISVGGFLGFRAYQTSNNQKILQGAVAQLAALPKMSSKLDLSATGFTAKGKLEVDSDQNVRLTLTEAGLPGSLVYLKKKDTLYIADAENSKLSTKKFTEYKNAWKAATNSEAMGADTAQLLPQKSWLTASSARGFTRGSDEVVEGKKQYRFIFVPTTEQIGAIKDSLEGGKSGVDITVDEAATRADVWIDAASGRVSKLDIRAAAKLAATGDTASATTSQGMETSYTLSWQQSFNYDFNEAIKLPIGARIINTTDAAAAYDENFGTGAANKAKDETIKAEITTLKTAVEQYKKDKGSYPTAVDATELLTVLTAGDNPYLTSDYDITNINYEYDAKTSKYKFGFRLNNQNESGANITGSAPNKVYTVSN